MTMQFTPGLILSPKMFDPRNFQLADFLVGDALPADKPSDQPSLNAAAYMPTNWNILSNNALGDCVEAAQGHLLMNQTACLGADPTSDPPKVGARINIGPPLAEQAYAEITGWNYVGKGYGTDPMMAMAYWQKTGFPIGQTITPHKDPTTGLVTYTRDVWARHRITAYTQFDQHNYDLVKTVVDVFRGGLCYLFVPKFLTAPGLAHATSHVWDVQTPDGGIVGAHAVTLIDYIPAIGPIVVSWGRVCQVTWAFWDKYFQWRGNVVVSPSLIDPKTLLVPSGLDIQALRSRLDSL